MGLMQIASIVLSHGHEVDLTLLTRNYIDDIDSFRPDLLAVSMMSSEYARLKHSLHNVKNHFPNLPILVGGPHVTFIPGTIAQMPADGVCVGEGEAAIIDVLKRVEDGRDWSDLHNISVDGQQPILRPLLTDLDGLPFINREIVYKRSPALRRFKMRSFYTTRGCPFKCTYCFNHAFNKMYRGLGPVVRRRSVDNVLEEMEKVKKNYPTDFIRIADDSFILKEDQWLEEFCRKYAQRIKVPFYCLMRAEVVTPNIVRLLKQAGCASVCMSIESGDERIRREVLGRPVSDATIIKAFDMFNQAGISIYTNSMLALPTATIEDEWTTLKLNYRCRPSYASFTICVPYPGTRMFDFCQEKGLLDIDMDYDNIPESVWDLSILNSYSRKEKRIHKNITLLGPSAVELPWLRKLITVKLLSLPSNLLYLATHYFMKSRLFKKRIVRVPLSVRDYLVLGFAQLKSEMEIWRNK
jgi:radical SAM superfamily enzyme YgiQ (UPF0313 family)